MPDPRSGPDRRGVLRAAAGLAALPAIARAGAIDADVRTGTLQDVEHVVILMQENRAFDHYFGAMAGVRGFGDRLPIPTASGAPDQPSGQTVWVQNQAAPQPPIAPFHLDTEADFRLMRAEGAPHTWPDAQAAWDEGRISRWPVAKTAHAMGHYRQADLPFQFALADAFTVCDAYHCSIQAGTNPNRVFLWTGCNGAAGDAGGPCIGNSHDRLAKEGGWPEAYRWTTYVERLHAAGVSWRLYQDMADNFTDNPLAGFKTFRDAHDAPTGAAAELIARAMSTQYVDQLRADVLADRLPQVSYVIGRAKDSEHPVVSSPAQGADFTARVLDALTANPKVFSRTVLLVMYDENDGLFDHMPPPAPPSADPAEPGKWFGGSTVDTAGEYHHAPAKGDAAMDKPAFVGRPYGLGPRVPMLVISPWSRGGWVNSEVFDHTSVIRFLERRFGVHEPNITPWRRAVCGDLTSAFDFRRPNGHGAGRLPDTVALAMRAAALPGRIVATAPDQLAAPVQGVGVRPSRALPYRLEALPAVTADAVHIRFANTGTAGAVLHVYDRHHLDRVPRRYTVEAGRSLQGDWPLAEQAGYDLWLLGPNGFHRHVKGPGRATGVEPQIGFDPGRAALTLTLTNAGPETRGVTIEPLAYAAVHPAWRAELKPNATTTHHWSLAPSHGWYDLVVRIDGEPLFLRRFAGRLETGRDSLSDPAMGGPALLTSRV